MKRKLILKIFMLMLLVCAFEGLRAQNDAFFYEVYSEAEREEGLQFDMLESAQSKGLSFGEFAADELGLNFGGFLKDENGLNFGEFEFEDVDVTLGSGLLLLSGMAFLRLKTRNKKDE